MISIHDVDILYSLKHPLHNMEMVKKNWVMHMLDF